VISNYFEYERRLASEVVLPTLLRDGKNLDGSAMLDAGCGYGGVIVEIGRRFRLGRAVGIDLDEEMIAAAQKRAGPEVDFRVEDFLACARNQAFDWILIRDVLEHIVDFRGALIQAAHLLKQDGKVYLSYAPFFSPFGGHQHNGSGPFSRVPWLQIFPERIFRSLLGVRGNSYKSAGKISEDIESVLRTRLTLGKFAAAAREAGFQTVFRKRYLVRPDYRIKFGLPPLALPDRFSGLHEFLCTGEETVLAKTS
jgi:SAM-dependent methyltransferase